MNKEDNFRKFIQENKEAFETDFDQSRLWNRIESKIPTKGKTISLHWMMKVAAVGLLLVSAFVMGRMTMDTEQTLADVDTQMEMQEINAYYARQVNELIIEARQASVEEDVFQDLKIMDAQQDELWSDYELANDKEKEFILSAMINNYQTRIDLLNHVLTKIKNNTNGNTVRNEKIKI